MSQVIRLNGTDYLNILTWFELAFAKVGKGEMKDQNTKNKICQMAIQLTKKNRRCLENDEK